MWAAIAVNHNQQLKTKTKTIFMDSLKRLENELKNCVKCGACSRPTARSSAVGRSCLARGKIALARAALSGQLSLDARTGTSCAMPPAAGVWRSAPMMFPPT
jgi:hypothetical protein